MPRSYPPEFRRRVIDLVESGWPVAEVAADLGVSDQTVYNWWNHHLIDSGRKPGVSSTDNAELTAVQVGYHAVTMLMARAGLQSLPGNRRRKSTGGRTALDLVDRNFARTEPDQLWVTDITEHPTREGKVYWRFAFQRGVTVASSAQLGRPA